MAKASKGAIFERDLCKLLSDWWTGGKRKDVFWRAASSGAMATQRAKSGQTAFGQHGDIQATDPMGQALTRVFSIEAKRGYKEATFWDLINCRETKTGTPKEWEKWWGQAFESKFHSDALSPLLVHKTDRKETIVYFEYKVFKMLRKHKGWAGHQQGITPFIKANILVKPFRTFKGGRFVIVAMQLADFLALDPECVMDVYEKYVEQ